MYIFISVYNLLKWLEINLCDFVPCICNELQLYFIIIFVQDGSGNCLRHFNMGVPLVVYSMGVWKTMSIYGVHIRKIIQCVLRCTKQHVCWSPLHIGLKMWDVLLRDSHRSCTSAFAFIYSMMTGGSLDIIARRSINIYISRVLLWAIMEQLSIRRGVRIFLVGWRQKTRVKHCFGE